MTEQEMRDQTATLLRKSASDEEVLGFDGISPHIAAFHGQQAIEKLLKAWLFALRIQPPKTHSFKKLITLLEIEGCTVPKSVFRWHASATSLCSGATKIFRKRRHPICRLCGLRCVSFAKRLCRR